MTLNLDHSLCFDQCELQDQVGGMDATLMNGATCTPGEGIVFGGNDYVDLEDVQLGGPMSIAFWVRWDGGLGTWSRVCDFGDGAPADNIYLSNRGADDETSVEFSIFIGDSNRATQFDGIVLGAWTHLVGTVQGTTQLLYQDGSYMSGSSYWGQEATLMTRTNHYLGKSNWGNLGFQGAISSMQIWSRALDADEVAELYALDGVCLGATQTSSSQYNCPPEFTDCGTFCDYDSDCYGDNYCGDGSWDLCGDDYVNGTCALRNALRKALSTLAESNSTPALLPSYRTHRVLLLYDMRRRVLMR